MKGFNLSACAFLLCASLLLTSCAGSDPADPGNGGKGMLSGYTILNDEYARPVADRSGAVVTMLGTSYSTTTNAEGYWKFDDLPTGTYIVRYMKEGYAERRIYNFKFVAPGYYYSGEFDLYRYPSYSISGLRIYVVDTIHQHLRFEIGDTAISDTGIVVTGHRDTMVTRVVTGEKRLMIEGEIDQVIPQGLRGYVAIVIGADASVSKESGKHRTILHANVMGGGSYFTAALSSEQFAENSLSVGDHLYAVAYPMAPSTDLIYDEPERRVGIPAYIASNPSSVVDFVL